MLVLMKHKTILSVGQISINLTLKANFIVSRVLAGLHTTDKAITYSLISILLSSC